MTTAVAKTMNIPTAKKAQADLLNRRAQLAANAAMLRKQADEIDKQRKELDESLKAEYGDEATVRFRDGRVATWKITHVEETTYTTTRKAYDKVTLSIALPTL